MRRISSMRSRMRKSILALFNPGHLRVQCRSRWGLAPTWTRREEKRASDAFRERRENQWIRACMKTSKPSLHCRVRQSEARKPKPCMFQAGNLEMTRILSDTERRKIYDTFGVDLGSDTSAE